MDDPVPFSMQWYEGMLLSPQHLQYFCSGLRAAFPMALRSVSNFCYGVNSLKIDTASLANGMIRVLNLAGIFQDGAFFDFDALKDPPLEKNVKDKLAATSDNVKIFLAVVRNRVGENLFAEGEQRYYSSVAKNVKDENTGENPMDICIIKPKLQLLFSDEIDARYVHFPLMEIRKSENNGIDIVNYVPPVTVLNTHSRIVELVRNLVLTLRNKISFFSDRKGNTSFILGEEIQSNLKLLIQATLPLEAIVKMDLIQPFLCYEYLIHSASILASMNTEQAVPSLPKYDHENLYDTFSRLSEFCKKSIDYIKQPFVTMLFEKVDDVFNLTIEKSWLKEKEFYISIKRRLSQSDNELLEWINGSQIASESCMNMVKDRRILGAERRIVERGENIVPPTGSVLLSINSQDPYIVPSEKLHICNPASSTVVPEEIVFYVDQ